MPVVSPEAFLALVLKHCKEKPQIDFGNLAIEAGLSKGGAANKYRLLMQQFEREGVNWGSKPDSVATNANARPRTPATGTKRKASTMTTATPEATIDAGGEMPKKKARITATRTKKTAPKAEFTIEENGVKKEEEVDNTATTSEAEVETEVKSEDHSKG